MFVDINRRYWLGEEGVKWNVAVIEWVVTRSHTKITRPVFNTALAGSVAGGRA